MAFDFMDLFPDSPAAVAGSQGARDILENQYKQSMGFMDMEQALMRTAQARKQIAEQARLEPLAKTVDAVKLLQGLNLASGNEAFKDVDLNDPNSLNQTLQSAVQSGQLMTNVEAELAKSRLGAMEATARAQMLEGGRNSRESSERAAEREKQNREAAFKRLEELNKRYPKSPLGQRKAEALVSDYESLKSMGNDEATRAFYNKHSTLLAAAGHDAPGVVAKKAAPKATESGGGNITYKSKSGKTYIIKPDGSIEGQ